MGATRSLQYIFNFAAGSIRERSSLISLKESDVPLRPQVNIGTLGHVDNGKSTLVQAITGVWTGRHSEELRRGITIRIGYADAFIYKCPKCEAPLAWTTKKECANCGGQAEFVRGISFVDCPGHHSLMVTMLSGAALMDGALFVLAANTKCPQAQDREHLLAAQMASISKIIIVQNKIDIVSRERALENLKEIEAFVKGTIAEDAEIIPVSAQHGANIDVLLGAIDRVIPTPKRDLSADPRLYVLRSFDVNKPGTEAEGLAGGVLGGSVVQGVFRMDDEIEISPGIKVESGNKVAYELLRAKVSSLQVSTGPVKEASPGGLVGIGTSLDPSLTKSDGLVGSVVGNAGKLPPVLDKVSVGVQLFEKAVGTEELVAVERIRTNEPLVLNMGTAVTSGVVTSARDEVIDVNLKKPICAESGLNVAISRRIGDSWRLIGYGKIR